MRKWWRYIKCRLELLIDDIKYIRYALLSRPHLRTVKRVLTHSVYDLEYHYIILRSIVEEYLDRWSQQPDGCQNEIKIRNLKLIRNLIDIAFLNGGDVYKNGLYNMVGFKITYNIKVNKRNRYRFERRGNTTQYDDYLYMIKAKHLLHKIMTEIDLV